MSAFVGLPTAAAWSLQDALDALTTMADAEDAQIGAERAAAADPMRSPVWGGTRAGGTHADPTGGAVSTLTRPARRNRYADRYARTLDTLSWLADEICDPHYLAQPLARIRHAIPQLDAHDLDELHHWLTEHDDRCRQLLGRSQALEPIPGDCPGCDVRSLMVWLAGPRAAWTVVCSNCQGIWPAAAAVQPIAA